MVDSENIPKDNRVLRISLFFMIVGFILIFPLPIYVSGCYSDIFQGWGSLLHLIFDWSLESSFMDIFFWSLGCSLIVGSLCFSFARFFNG